MWSVEVNGAKLFERESKIPKRISRAWDLDQNKQETRKVLQNNLNLFNHANNLTVFELESKLGELFGKLI